MDAHLLRPSKPVLTSIPLVVSAGDFACTSSGEAASPAPRTESLRGRTTDDGDLLELEQVALGVVCNSYTSKGWAGIHHTCPLSQLGRFPPRCPPHRCRRFCRPAMQARKKLGLTCPSFTEKKKKKGLLGWLRRKSTTPQ